MEEAGTKKSCRHMKDVRREKYFSCADSSQIYSDKPINLTEALRASEQANKGNPTELLLPLR